MGEHCLPSAPLQDFVKEPGKYFQVDAKVQRAESTKPRPCLLPSARDCGSLTWYSLSLALPRGWCRLAEFCFYWSLYILFLRVFCQAAKIQYCAENWPSKLSSAHGTTAVEGWSRAGFFPQLGLILLCFLMPRSSYFLVSLRCYC